jgi:hypothetical protein
MCRRFCSFRVSRSRVWESTRDRRSALTVEAMADDALAIMEREQIRQFHVVGQHARAMAAVRRGNRPEQAGSAGAPNAGIVRVGVE